MTIYDIAMHQNTAVYLREQGATLDRSRAASDPQETQQQSEK